MMIIDQRMKQKLLLTIFAVSVAACFTAKSRVLFVQSFQTHPSFVVSSKTLSLGFYHRSSSSKSSSQRTLQPVLYTLSEQKNSIDSHDINSSNLDGSSSVTNDDNDRPKTIDINKKLATIASVLQQYTYQFRKRVVTFVIAILAWLKGLEKSAYAVSLKENVQNLIQNVSSNKVMTDVIEQTTVQAKTIPQLFGTVLTKGKLAFSTHKRKFIIGSGVALLAVGTTVKTKLLSKIRGNNQSEVDKPPEPISIEEEIVVIRQESITPPPVAVEENDTAIKDEIIEESTTLETESEAVLESKVDDVVVPIENSAIELEQDIEIITQPTEVENNLDDYVKAQSVDVVVADSGSNDDVESLVIETPTEVKDEIVDELPSAIVAEEIIKEAENPVETETVTRVNELEFVANAVETENEVVEDASIKNEVEVVDTNDTKITEEEGGILSLSSTKERIKNFFKKSSNIFEPPSSSETKVVSSSSSTVEPVSASESATETAVPLGTNLSTLAEPLTKAVKKNVSSFFFGTEPSSTANGKVLSKVRKQPKSPDEERKLQAKYSAIPTLEERAFQILVDLGMVEITTSTGSTKNSDLDEAGEWE